MSESDDENVSDLAGDTSLRAAFRSHLKAQQPAAREACPSPEALEALARGAADGNPNLAQLEHVLGCAACEAEFALLRSIADAEASERQEAPVAAPTAGKARHSESARSPRIWSARNLAAAAVVLVAVGLGSQRLRQSRDARIDDARTRDSIVRDAGARDADGGGAPTELALIAPLEDVTEPLPVFVWHAVPGTARYVVEALDTSGVTIVSRETTDTTVTLTADEATQLRRQTAADWMVTARRVDGNERRSPVVRVRVTPSAAR